MMRKVIRQKGDSNGKKGKGCGLIKWIMEERITAGKIASKRGETQEWPVWIKGVAHARSMSPFASAPPRSLRIHRMSAVIIKPNPHRRTWPGGAICQLHHAPKKANGLHMIHQ